MDQQWMALLTNLNMVDFAIIGIILLSVIISVIRGFVREALSLVTWVLALWVAFTFTDQGAALLVGRVDGHSVQLIISFVVLFLTVLIIGSLISYLVTTMVKKTGLSGTDRIVGAFFGILRGALIVTFAIIAIDFTAYGKATLWQASIVVPHFQGLVDWLQHLMPEVFNFIIR